MTNADRVRGPVPVGADEAAGEYVSLEHLSAAKKLQAAGELRRVRVPAERKGGEPARILWFRGSGGGESDDRQQNNPPT